ncbi:MAG: MBL fold metallo-hydrolase [Rikenellaceae bacterium]|jgi:phosphoribosyl 1,2-cyclic phosphate phosphodiesterase|nr:MBL fold metallo-hydrolase [Rikenellaceae bacterium]
MTKLTFLGTGTSQGVPVISCTCRVCASPDERDKRLRAAVLVEHGGATVVIDAGPDFRQQMLSQRVMHIDGIVLTHEHKDHTGGIDDVRAFNYTSGKPVAIYSEPRVQRIIKKDFDYAFAEYKYPGVPEIDLVDIGEEHFRIAGPDGAPGMELIPIRGHHFRLPVLGFRVGGIAYLTDFNAIEEKEIDKIKGVDVLVINALRREYHVSHFTLKEALDIREKVGARVTYLTHLSHQIGRHAELLDELPEGVYPAYDGLIATSEE